MWLKVSQYVPCKLVSMQRAYFLSRCWLLFFVFASPRFHHIFFAIIACAKVSRRASGEQRGESRLFSWHRPAALLLSSRKGIHEITHPYREDTRAKRFAETHLAVDSGFWALRILALFYAVVFWGFIRKIRHFSSLLRRSRAYRKKIRTGSSWSITTSDWVCLNQTDCLQFMKKYLNASVGLIFIAWQRKCSRNANCSGM